MADRRKEDRVTLRDVPALLDALAGSDSEEKERALTLLCPCRNRRYDRALWLEILRVYQKADASAGVRDRAFHAIGTLLQRARTDPRSQELLLWLDEQDASTLPLAEAIPRWTPRRPGSVNGLRVPRPERARRSRANRRR